MNALHLVKESVSSLMENERVQKKLSCMYKNNSILNTELIVHFVNIFSSPLLHSQKSTPVSSQSPGCSVTPEEREMFASISGLLGMFPNKHRDEIEQALRAARNDFDVAVDFLIDNKFAEYSAYSFCQYEINSA